MEQNLQQTEAPVQDAPEVEVVEATPEPQDQPEAKPVDDVAFPKKAVNAISRRDKQIGKLKAEMAALSAELEKYRTPTQAAPQKQASDGRPSVDQFDDYGAYLEALSEWKIEQKFTTTERKNQETQLSQKQAQYIEMREAEIAEKAQGHVKSIPDFLEIVETNSDILDMLPVETQMAFYEADDAALAFYNLAKSGKLEQLATMSPYRAAMEIARAQVMPARQTTNAPRPVTGVRGSGASSTSLENKSPEEIMKWLKS